MIHSDAVSESVVTGTTRTGHLIKESWSDLSPLLRDEGTDAGFVIRYLEPLADAFYWEVHFEGARLTRTDFLQRVPLAVNQDAAEGSPDPIVEPLVRWYGAHDAAEHCYRWAWLELDGPLRDSLDRVERRQGVSICLDPHFGTAAGGDPLGFARRAAAAATLVERLQWACTVTSAGLGVLQRVSEVAVELGGTVRHVSVMRGRPGTPCKIYAALPKRAFAPFLRQIGWPGNVEHAMRLAETVGAESRLVNCDLQFTNELSARIGFELFFDPSPAPDPFRRGATRLALEKGLLSAPTILALESWVGLARKHLGNDRWPTRIQRWFDLKFVAQPNGEIELKTYLGFRESGGIF